MRYEIEGEMVRAWVDEDCYWTTNPEGEGVFWVDTSKNVRKQKVGTCDFSVAGLTDEAKKAKLRRWIMED